MHPVPVAPEETIVGLIAWRDLTLLGVRGPNGSLLKNLSPQSALAPQGQILLDGELEFLWQSPTGQAFAWVARLTEQDGVRRRQFGISHRKIVYTGNFTANAFDLVWSPDGREAALRIQEGIRPNAMERLVASRFGVAIQPGCHVDEFCVNNRGQVVAWIQSDGRFSVPNVRWAQRPPVELAWNLSRAGDGTISYNALHSDVIVHVTDQTT
jgi:hypothetical protein